MNPLQVQRPPDLSPAPVLERFLLASPWTVIAVLVLIAAVVWFSMAGKRRRAVFAGIPLVLAVGAWVVSVVVETDREAVSGRTRELVSATTAVDLGRVRAILTSDARARYWAAPQGLELEPLLSRIGSELSGQSKLKDAKIHTVQATMDGPDLARTQVEVTVTFEATGVPNLSFWRIDWRRQGGEWRAFHIEPLAVAGVMSGG